MSPLAEGRVDLLHVFALGGPAMVAIAVVGLGVYGLLVGALSRLWGPGADAAAAARARDRLPLARAGIAAAPLLGLLGTVSGLIASFEGLMSAGRAEALAAGIGRAMITTEYGLMVAAPALILAGLVERRAAAVDRAALEAGR